MRDAVSSAYPVTFLSITPKQTVAEQDATYGKDLWKTDPNACCALRKVEPLERALSGYTAWISGLRRVEAVTRRNAKAVEWDAKRGMVKINPIVAWDDEELDKYIAHRGILINPLQYDGYPSDRLRPLHPSGRAGRRPPQRPLGRQRQGRVRAAHLRLRPGRAAHRAEVSRQSPLSG